MFKVGDIVRPKKGFSGHNYIFKISGENPFQDDLYKLQRIEQKLDLMYGPASRQVDIIKRVEETWWREKDIELTSNVELRYNVSNLDDINDIVETNSEFLNQYAKKLRKEYEIKINKINKEENEMQILDLYKERKKKAIEKEYSEKREEILQNDTIQSIILEMTNQVNAILENEDRKIEYEYQPTLMTSETEQKIEKLKEMQQEEIEKLRSTLDEIRALFELTDDYNERTKILKNYDILDKKGKLNV